MRIISGIYKGRRIAAGRDLSIRPTTDRIKELIFNVLQDFPEGRSVADLFSGSGNLGIEALSRGAEHVFFVEKAAASLTVLQENLASLNIPSSSYTIVRQDALDFTGSFPGGTGLFLIDPPFVYPPLQTLVDRLLSSPDFMEEAIVVLEHEINNPIEKQTDQYSVFKQKQKGRSLISFIEKVVS